MRLVAPETPEGFFIFSKAQKKRADLKSWETFFKKKKIKTCCITDDAGNYYLCREGEEAI